MKQAKFDVFEYKHEHSKVPNTFLDIWKFCAGQHKFSQQFGIDLETLGDRTILFSMIWKEEKISKGFEEQLDKTAAEKCFAWQENVTERCKAIKMAHESIHWTRIGNISWILGKFKLRKINHLHLQHKHIFFSAANNFCKAKTSACTCGHV
jgi:hypothetical protein